PPPTPPPGTPPPPTPPPHTPPPTPTPPPVTVTTIDVSLVNHGTTNTPFGTSTGYAPAVTNVSVGSMVKFHNSDGFSHTATSIPGSPMQFPAADPFTNAAMTQSGTTLSGGFSSGTLMGGANSQLILADKAGTYLYGCFFHYASSGMRAAIVAQ
ncbi:MAG: hypothetical protein JO233_05595, partial [Candidatus Eremiobacteraeota bacterium]|nr:hypothetical protein [Candidatus Eremiobacteraeota bacterium]